MRFVSSGCRAGPSLAVGGGQSGIEDERSRTGGSDPALRKRGRSFDARRLPDEGDGLVQPALAPPALRKGRHEGAAGTIGGGWFARPGGAGNRWGSRRQARALGVEASATARALPKSRLATSLSVVSLRLGPERLRGRVGATDDREDGPTRAASRAIVCGDVLWDPTGQSRGWPARQKGTGESLLRWGDSLGQDFGLGPEGTLCRARS